MNLLEMRQMVASILDYDPAVKTYKDEIRRYLNETYRNWFTSRPYAFSQKTVDIYTMPDAGFTGTVTPDSSNVTSYVIINETFNKDTIGNPAQVYRFNESHEGSTCLITGASTGTNNGTFMCDKVLYASNAIQLSKISSSPQVDWQGSSGVPQNISGSLQQRWMTMPEDCNQILSVGIRNLTEGDGSQGTNAMGHIFSLTRRKDEELNLRYDLTGTPTDFVVYDSIPENLLDVTHWTPRAGKDFQVSAISSLYAGWPAGDYEFKMSYVWHGVEGPLSDAFTLSMSAGKIPRFDTLDTTSSFGFYGLRKKFYVRIVKIAGFSGNHSEDFFRDLSSVYCKPTPNTGDSTQFNYFLNDDSVTSVDWPEALLPIETVSQLLRYSRQDVNIGTRKRIRLYPRPTTITPVEFRYIYVPKDLMDDYDQPASPDDTHRFIVYQTCAEAFMKHNNPDMADYYTKKAEKELLKIDNKYLTQRSAYYIKDSFIAGPLRVKPYQTLTKLPDK